MEKIVEIRTEIRSFHAGLANGILREKARRVAMLFSLAGIIWCFGVSVKKVSPGGFEIVGMVPMIPLILFGTIFFFTAQFWVYAQADNDQAEYWQSELSRAETDLLVLAEGATKHGLYIDSYERLTDELGELRNNSQILIKKTSPCLNRIAGCYIVFLVFQWRCSLPVMHLVCLSTAQRPCGCSVKAASRN